METLITSLLLALISALTFIAYKHPAGYRKIYLPLLLSLFGAFFFVTTWDMSAESTYSKIYERINIEGNSEATLKAMDQLKQIKPSLTISKNSWAIPLIWLLVNAFLYGLSRLPSILADEKQDTTPKEQSPQEGQNTEKK